MSFVVEFLACFTIFGFQVKIGSMLFNIFFVSSNRTVHAFGPVPVRVTGFARNDNIFVLQLIVFVLKIVQSVIVFLNIKKYRIKICDIADRLATASLRVVSFIGRALLASISDIVIERSIRVIAFNRNAF